MNVYSTRVMQNNTSNLKADLAAAYIARLKSQSKRDYAQAYLDYILNQLSTPTPDYHSYELSYMGAQAVRFEIRDLLKSENTPI